MFGGYNEYEIWFDFSGAHATLPVRFVDPEEGLGEEDVEFVLELYVSAWESSCYRPTERDFEIEDFVLEAFGRTYRFDLDEVIPSDSARDRFLAELERRYDDYADECRAEACL